MEAVLTERRTGASRFEGRERRLPALRGHGIAVGPDPWRPGWVQATCECGEQSRSRVAGAVECWVRYHQAEIHPSS